jgi:hypothetical protein
VNKRNGALNYFRVRSQFGTAIAGLSAIGLVLQDSGGDNLTINGSGPFTPRPAWVRSPNQERS